MKQKHLFIAILTLVTVLLITSGCIIDPTDPKKTKSPEDSASYEYVKERDKITITKYTGNEKDVVIPSTIDGINVTAIGEECFAGTQITSLRIPKTVKKLGDFMCYNVSTLEQLTFENEYNITSIGKSIINGTKAEKNISLEDPFYIINGILVRVNPEYEGILTVPEEIEIMTSGAFEGSKAKAVEFGTKFETVFATDLYSMDNLQYVAINNPKTVIERSGMFSRDDQYIKTVNNSSVIEYAEYFGYFYDVTTDKDEWEYEEDGEGIKITGYKGSSMYVRIPEVLSGKTVVSLGEHAVSDTVVKLFIPENVKRLDDGFAMGAKLLEKVSFGNAEAIEYIGAYAFRDTKFELEVNKKNDMSVIGGILVRHFGSGEISVGKGVRAVSGRAFKSDVIGVTFAEGVTRFEDGMFLDSPDVEYVSIPNSMTDVNIRAFDGCVHIVIRCDAVAAAAKFASENDFDCEAIYFWEYETDDDTKTAHLLQYTGEQTYVIVPEMIYDYPVVAVDSIRNTKAESVYIPASVKSISGMFAFSLKTLQEVFFEDITQLEYIGEQAFYGTSFEKNAFDSNNGLNIVGKILAGSNATGSVSVPEDVEVIAPLAFYGSEAENIVLPESVKKICSWAFRSCTNLKTVYIKDLVTEIGDNILDDSRNAVVLCHKNSYTESYVKSHGYNYEIVDYEVWDYDTFGDGIRLKKYKGTETNIIVPRSVCGETVTTIGESCFADSNAVKVVIPSTITTINNSAFENVTTLQSVVFEDASAIQFIGDFVFSNTEYYNSLVPDESTGCFTINGIVIKSLADGIININEDTKIVAGGAFAGATTTYIVVNEACRRIGSYAFANSDLDSMQGLEAVYIPDSVKEIGRQILGKKSDTVIYCHENSIALEYASANGYKYQIMNNDYIYEENKAENTVRLLKYTGENKSVLSIPRYINGKTVTVIGQGCFADKIIDKIYFHDDIRKIEADAFCVSLKEVEFENVSKLEKIEENAFNGTTFWAENTSEFFMIGSILIRCRGIDEVIIPENVKVVAGGAFAGNEATTISILHSDITLDDYAFKGAKKAQWIYISPDVSKIGKNILEDTDMIIRCEAGSFAEQYAAQNGYKVIVDTEGYDWVYVVESDGITISRYSGNDTDVVIPSYIAGLAVIEIEDNCFDGSNITSVVIPQTVKRIGNEAFANTKNLTVITFSNAMDISSIGYGIFDGSAVLESLYDENGFAIINRILIAYKGSGDVVLYDDIKKIAGRAFANNKNITSITVNSVCRSIGMEAFAGLDNLMWVLIPDSVYELEGEIFSEYDMTVRCSENSVALDYAVRRGVNTEIVESNFEYEEVEHGVILTGYKGTDKHVIIPSRIGNKDVITIGTDCFKGKEIEYVYIPSTVSELGDFCFAYCAGLSEVEFEDETSITTIGDRTFIETYYENVSGVDINGMLAINDILVRHFGTGDIVISSEIQQIVGGAFLDNQFVESIRINDGCKSIEKNAFSRLTKLKEITIPTSVKYIDNEAFAECNEAVVIECYKNSYAEQFANANNYSCKIKY